MSNTVKRIKEYIDYKGISIRKFEESIGFSNGAFASQYKKNKTIGVDKVEKILQVYLDINPVWLLTGQDSMILQSYNDSDMTSKRGRIPESGFGSVDYKEKYIEELEKQIELLKDDLKQKQDIIQGFLTGSLLRSNM